MKNTISLKGIVNRLTRRNLTEKQVAQCGKRILNKMGAQGDLLLRKCVTLPKEGLSERGPKNGAFILAHSETGHHHLMEAEGVKVYDSPDPFVSYMEVFAPKGVEVKHLRDWDTHEAVQVPRGTYEIRNQVQKSPTGWQRVAD